MRRPNQLSMRTAGGSLGSRSRAVLTLLVGGLLVLGVAIPAQAGGGTAAAANRPAAAPLSCDQMVGQTVKVQNDVARVATAVSVAASGTTSAYCELNGTISTIRFTMRLPRWSR